MKETKVCPKCGAEMKRGRLVFQLGASQGNVAWSEKGGERFALKELPEIQAYLCQKCGYVESYVEIKK